MSEFLAWCAVVLLLIVIAWMSRDLKDLRAENKRLWDADDIRRGIKPEPGLCEVCGVDVEDYLTLCASCQRTVLQSGDVG